jgi:hypothetical protein
MTICFLFALSVFANPYLAFNNVLNGLASKDEAEKVIDVFTKDFGQAISGGSFGLGTCLGDTNVYVSVKMSYQEVSDNNVIVKSAGTSDIYFPIVQFLLKIPYDFNVLARFSYFDDATILGGGFTHDLLKSEYILLPSVTFQMVYNHAITSAENNKFNASNLKNSITINFLNLLYAKPYFFVSYDLTHLNVVSSKYSGLSSNVKGFGYGAGLSLDLNIINFTGAISMYENQPNYSLGLLMNF